MAPSVGDVGLDRLLGWRNSKFNDVSELGLETITGPCCWFTEIEWPFMGIILCNSIIEERFPEEFVILSLLSEVWDRLLCVWLPNLPSTGVIRSATSGDVLSEGAAEFAVDDVLTALKVPLCSPIEVKLVDFSSGLSGEELYMPT